MRCKQYLPIILLLLLFFSGCSGDGEKKLDPGIYAWLRTNKGTITIRLEYEKVPMLVANFIGLAEGIFTAETIEYERFYDNSSFFDVAPDVLIKGGMPFEKDRINSDYYLPKNFHPDLKHDCAGAVSMLLVVSNIHGSLFSITLKKLSWLDYKQPVLGYVVSGISHLKSITRGDILKNVEILRIYEQAFDFNVSVENFNKLKEEVEKKNWEAKKARNETVIPVLKERWPNLIETRSGIYFAWPLFISGRSDLGVK